MRARALTQQARVYCLPALDTSFFMTDEPRFASRHMSQRQDDADAIYRGARRCRVMARLYHAAEHDYCYALTQTLSRRSANIDETTQDVAIFAIR